MRPVAIRRNPGFDVFNVRLLIGLDKLLREKRRYQGDLSASINDALLAGNLNDLTIGQVLLIRKASIYRQQHVERRCFRLFEKFTILSPANPAYRAV